MSFRKIYLIISVIIIVIGLFLFYPPVRRYCCSGEYQTFYSPDRNYRIVVYRISVFPSMMPGSSGDAPGYIRLFNSKNEILEEAPVDMVGLLGVNEIYWEKSNVHIKLLADWELPDI